MDKDPEKSDDLEARIWAIEPQYMIISWSEEDDDWDININNVDPTEVAAGLSRILFRMATNDINWEWENDTPAP